MFDISAALLVQFFQSVDVLLILLVRVLTFFIVLPILSGSSLPNIAKIMLSLCVALLLFTAGTVQTVTYENSMAGYIMLAVKEFFVGFSMGFSVYIVFTVVYLAGQLIDFQLGLSMVSVFDPISQIQVPIMGNWLYLLMGVLLVQSGGLHALISAMAYSYEAVPVGAGVILGNDDLIMYIVGLFTQYFIIGMKLSFPIVGSVLIIDFALGILVKAVPQMNVFVVGMPMKILIGIIILYFIMPAFVAAFDSIYNMTYSAISNVIGGLAP